MTRTAARGWLVVVVVAVLGVLAIALLQRQQGTTGAPNDPRSAAKDGSRAVARLLQRRSVDSSTGTSVDQAVDTSTDTTIVVLTPDQYSRRTLQRLAAGHRLVLLAPTAGTADLAGVGGNGTGGGLVSPGCSDSLLRAAGPVRFESDTLKYTPGQCYGGRVVRTDRITVVGDESLFTNRYLAAEGRAALAMNVLGADTPGTRLYWLRPTVAATSDTSAGGSLFDLFPGWVPRSVLWLALVGLFVVLWKARRLGRPVTEPLPIVVRSVELVEGRGRLYRRANDRERAAAALRTGAVHAAAERLRLPRATSTEQVVHTLEATGRWPGGHVYSLLLGPTPADDDALVDLATRLDALVADLSPALLSTERLRSDTTDSTR